MDLWSNHYYLISCNIYINVCVGYQKFQLKGKKMLHQAVCSDTFYSEDFVQIVKGLGKNWLVGIIIYVIM